MRPVWLLLGDSLTQRGFEPGGWASVLANAYARSIDVHCRGYSGYNSRWVAGLLPRILPLDATSPPPQLLILLLGANDACLPDRTSSKQHVPLEEYRGNLRAIVEHGRAAGIAHTLLLSPPPVHEPSRIRHALQYKGLTLDQAERSAQVTAAYAAAAGEAAGELGVPFLDLHSLFSGEQQWESKLLCDGLHFTHQGQQAVGAWVLGGIADAFPALAPAAMAWESPDWPDIDDEHWEESLARGGANHP